MISFDPWQKFVIGYLLAINLITFFIFALDKIKAVNNERRISERWLWFLVLFGGPAGALVGMNIFRHKTKKLSFQAVLAVIFLLQIWLVYFVLR